MAKVLVTKEKLNAIGDSIREKLGVTDTYKLDDMPEAISSIGGDYDDIWDLLVAPPEIIGYRHAVVVVPVNKSTLAQVQFTFDDDSDIELSTLRELYDYLTEKGYTSDASGFHGVSGVNLSTSQQLDYSYANYSVGTFSIYLKDKAGALNNTLSATSSKFNALAESFVDNVTPIYASTSYRHDITIIYYYNRNIKYRFEIINDSNEQFTVPSLYQYFVDNGYTDKNNTYPIAWSRDGGTTFNNYGSYINDFSSGIEQSKLSFDTQSLYYSNAIISDITDSVTEVN